MENHNTINTIDQALKIESETGAVLTIREIIDTHWDYEDISMLNDVERLFVFVENVEREVNNGGFDQFFLNSSGDYARESYEALNTIGATKAAAILKRAMSIFPGGEVPKEAEMREEELEKTGEDGRAKWFDACDTEYYEQNDENIGALLLKYVRENSSGFRDRLMLTGVRINVVNPGSRPYAAGLRSGDILLKINDMDITAPEEFTAAMGLLKQGEQIVIIVLRNGEFLRVEWRA